MTTRMKDMHGWLFALGDDGFQQRLFDAMRRLHDSDDAQIVHRAKLELEEMASSEKVPWLGVFARHWELQHRINEQAQGATAISDAEAAMDATLAPETKDCPQSICATQDLAMAYTATDGPGYADKVIEACRETLDRIDPSWPCYDCLSAELRDALINKAEYSAAVELMDEVEVEIRSVGERPSSSYPLRRLEALLDSGQVEEAGQLVDNLDEESYEQAGPHSPELLLIASAEARLANGDSEAALDVLRSDLDPIARPETAKPWLRFIDLCLETGAHPNDDKFSTTKITLANARRESGTYRLAFEMAVSAGTWAARRGAVTSAGRCLNLATEISDQLAKPMGAPDRLAALATEIDDAPERVTNENSIDFVAEELEYKLAEGTLEDSEVTMLAQLRRAQGWAAASEEILWRQIEAHPNNDDPAVHLIAQLGEQGDHEALVRLSSMIGDEHPLLVEWALAQAGAVSGDWSAAAEHARTIIASDPEALNSRRLLSTALEELGEYESAARETGEVLDVSIHLLAEAEGTTEEPHLKHLLIGDAWRSAICASLARDWAQVRKSAGVLGLELDPGDEPVDEDWEWVSITYSNDDGSEATFAAQRTGPATARILTVIPGTEGQKARDHVVFNPELLDPAPETEDKKANFVQRFRAIHTLDKGGYTGVIVQGNCPDAAEHDRLRQALTEASLPVWSYSEGPFEFDNGDSAFEIFSAVGHRNEDEARQITEIVERVGADWTVELVWSDPAS